MLFFKKIIKNSIFPSIVYILILLLNLHVTNVLSPDNWYVKFMSMPRKPITLINFIFFLTIMGIILENIHNETEKDNQNIISNYKTEISSFSDIIEAKYGEFSKHIKKDKLKNDIKMIINEKPILIGFTLHDYSFKLENDKYIIKVLCDLAIAQEGYDINNIVQKYYSIDKEIMNKINSLLIDYEYPIDDKLCRVETKTQEILELIQRKGYMDTPIYNRIELILLTKLEQLDSNIAIINNDLEDSKRTGILGSLILKDEYFYSYGKNKENKRNRAYMSFNLKVGDSKKIGTMILNMDDYPSKYIFKEIDGIYTMINSLGYDII